MDCQQLSYQDTFKRINAVAHSIQALCRSDNLPSLSMPSALSPDLAIHSPNLHLPVPAIPAHLLNVQCSPEIKMFMESAFIKAAHEIRDMCFAKHDKMVKFIQSNPSGSSQAEHSFVFFERQYQEQVHTLEELTIAKVIDLQEHQLDTTAKVKPTFNREFIPLLETYFNYNAYPSALDRATLARKSMMTPRQIEVWFQNHRNRAKKEGRKLKKLTTDPLPLELSLKPLEKEMPFFVIPEDHRKDPFPFFPPTPDADPEVDEVATSIQRNTDVRFNLYAPPHAFPTVYPPICDYDPFPRAYKFPAPVWNRKPSAPRRISKTPIDFDEFITDFDKKLHLKAPVSQKRCSNATGPWYASRITTPSPAPHPALVFSPVFSTSRPPTQLPTVRAPSSCLRPFRSPSPFFQPATLAPSQPFNLTPHRRKVARLLKRTPKNTSITHRRGSPDPAISEASPAPSRSSSSSSRTSSFGSEASSHRRPSSSSGSSSSSSSAPATPELRHATLTGDADFKPVSVSGFDFENMDRLLGDRIDDVSPVDGMRFNFSLTAHRKQSPLLVSSSPLPVT